MAQQSGNIITSAQTITGSWADVKDAGTSGEIATGNYSFFNTNIELDINDSENVQFRYLALDISGGLEYFVPFMNIKNNKIELDYVPFEIKNDEDQNIIIPIDLDQRVRILKLQVKALTVGSTAGIITTATYRQGYRQ